MKRIPSIIFLVVVVLFLATFPLGEATLAQSSDQSQVTPEEAKQILLSYMQRMNWPQTGGTCGNFFPDMGQSGEYDGSCASLDEGTDSSIRRKTAIMPIEDANFFYGCVSETSVDISSFYFIGSDADAKIVYYRNIAIELNNLEKDKFDSSSSSATWIYKNVEFDLRINQYGPSCSHAPVTPDQYQPLVDLMLEISPPSDEPSPPEQPEVTEPPVLGPATLGGRVTDGHGNPIVFAPVTVYVGEQTLESLTDQSGTYLFSDLPVNQPNFNLLEQSVMMQVCLSFYDPAYDPVPVTKYPYFSVRYGNDSSPVVCAYTQPFFLSESSGGTTYDIDLGDGGSLQGDWLAQIDPKLPANLSDVATIYFHTTQAVALAHLLKQDLDLPMDAVTFVKGGGDGACWHGQRSFGNQPWNSCMGLNAPFPFIGFGEDASKYQDWGRPDNREWHEVGHHFTADSFGNFMPDYAGRKNHTGYCTNNSSNDAWTEGLAEFYSMMVGREIVRDPLFPVYNSGRSSKTYFELNYQTWNNEEFAVAGILLDLVDNDQDYNIPRVSTGLRLTPHADDDKISISPTDLWQIIVTGKSNNSDSSLGYLFDVDDLYRTLVANQIGQDDLDKNGFTDLDDIFLAHGYFSDPNGNRQYDAGEVIGLSSHPAYTVAKVNSQGQSYTINCQAMPTREDAPDIPGGYLQVSATDQGGNAVPVDIYTVDIEFDAPYEYYAYSYDVPADALPNGRLYLILPPESYPSRATITVSGNGILGSDSYILDNVTYWNSVPNQEDTPLDTFTFTVQPVSNSVVPPNLAFFIGTGLFGLFCFGASFIVLIAGVVIKNKKIRTLGIVLISIVICVSIIAASFYAGSQLLAPQPVNPVYTAPDIQTPAGEIPFPGAQPTEMAPQSPPTLVPAVPTIAPTEAPHSQEVSPEPTIFNFATCSSPCLNDLSNMQTSFPEGITRLYLRFDYNWIAPGSDYARVWKNGGEEWVRYQCKWDGPENGVFETDMREPIGFRSGEWTMEIYINGQLITQNSFTVQGNHTKWEPAGTINRCK